MYIYHVEKYAASAQSALPPFLKAADSVSWFNIIQEHNLMLYFWMSGSNHGVYADILNPWKPALVTVSVFHVFMKVRDF